jgi:hypothetical protein
MIQLSRAIRATMEANFSGNPMKCTNSLPSSMRTSRVEPAEEQCVGSISSRKMLGSIRGGT